MSEKRLISGPVHLAIAAVLTAVPLTYSPGNGLSPKVALAGDAASFMPGGKTEFADVYTDPMITLGVTEKGAQAASGHQVDVIARHLSAYKRAMSRGELSLAANNLAAAARLPITPKMVADIDTELGVQSPLAIAQVARVAAAKQRMTS